MDLIAKSKLMTKYSNNFPNWYSTIFGKSNYVR
jgi:hypothetical protein